MLADRQIDTMKLIVAFSNSANFSKIELVNPSRLKLT
jgi:hypothetical protein